MSLLILGPGHALKSDTIEWKRAMQSSRRSTERQQPESGQCMQPNNGVVPWLEPWENPGFLQCVESELSMEQQLVDESEQAAATAAVQPTIQIGVEPCSKPREQGCLWATSTESKSDEGGGVSSRNESWNFD